MAGGVLAHTMVVRNPETLEATALLAGTELPDWATDLVHEDNLTEGSGSDKGYAVQKVDELKAEIERRNEDRDEDDLLSTEGKKADLIATLEADDADNA